MPLYKQYINLVMTLGSMFEEYKRTLSYQFCSDLIHVLLLKHEHYFELWRFCLIHEILYTFLYIVHYNDFEDH